MELSQILKSCLNPKVIVGIVAVIVLAYIFVPQIAQYTWVLFVLVCPLSMVLMMAAMNHGGNKQTNRLFICPECSFSYKEAEWAKKCAAYCKEHHACDVEITKHAVQQS